MNYEQLSRRCARIVGYHPDVKRSPLQCLYEVQHMRPFARAIASECIARELAEFVEEQKAVYANL